MGSHPVRMRLWSARSPLDASGARIGPELFPESGVIHIVVASIPCKSSFAGNLVHEGGAMRFSRITNLLCIAVALGACARQVPVTDSPVTTSPGTIATPQEIQISTSSPVARMHFLAGERLLDAGRPQEAAAHFRLAVESDPAFGYAYVRLANAAPSAEEFKTNLDLAAARASGMSEGERLLLEINRTFITNDAVKRLELSETLTRTYPDSPRAWLRLGMTQTGLNQHEAARRSYQTALTLDPNMYAARTALGFSFLFNEPRDLAQAKQQMEMAIASAPDEAKGYEFLGDVNRAMNQLEEAREAYGKAVEKDPTLGVATLKKGHINSFLGNFNEARAAYDAAIATAKDATRVTYANYRAFAHLHVGNPNAALAELKALVSEADVAVPAAQVNGVKLLTLSNAATIALHHEMVGDAEAIIAQLEEVATADARRVDDPDFTRRQNAMVLLWKGLLAATKDDYAAALRLAEEHRALLENDRNPRRLEDYHALLGLVELRQRNFAEAAVHFRQADLTDVYMKYRLALALEGAGETEEAKRLFKDVASWNFNSVGFALVRGDSQQRMAS